MITDLITFNVHARGRVARGAERNFDTASLATIINGPSVQERVKHGDLVGYYGHWPRVKFGMSPVEGGIADGKVVHIDPAIRVVHLEADPDGTIRHRTEFLNTPSGVIARALFESKQGGFSSVISVYPNTSPGVVKAFDGFDYILEPNVTFNRGHKVFLDSAESASGAEVVELMDSVLADYAGGAGVLAGLFDSVHRQLGEALATLEKVTNENEVYLAMLAKRGLTQVLDSVNSPELDRIAPVRHALPEDWDRFTEMPLVALDSVGGDKKEKPDTFLSNLAARLSFR